jgi:hypothetical protein
MPVRFLVRHLVLAKDRLLQGTAVVSEDTVFPQSLRAEVVLILAGILLHSCQELRS